MATKSGRDGFVYVTRFKHWRSGQIITVEKNGRRGLKAFRFPRRSPKPEKDGE